MNFIQEIKSGITNRTMDLFKKNIKLMSADQLIQLLIKSGIDSAHKLIKDLEKRNIKVPDDLKKEWNYEVK